MIDFSALVLRPCMQVLARPITVTPTISMPGAPPYAARGVLRSESVSIPLEDGNFLSTVKLTLGIRLAEFPTAPRQRDHVLVDGVTYVINDIIPDKQGGAKVVLRQVDA